MKKVAFILPMLPPYRITFFEELIASTYENFSWRVFHGIKDIEDGRPPYSGIISFDNSTFKSKQIKFGPLTAVIHKGLFTNVKAFNPDIIIIAANSGELTNWRIVSWAKRHNKKIILWVCSWDSGKSKGLFRLFKRQMMKRYYKYGNSFVTYSSHAKNLLTSLSFSPNSIEIAYNGLDIVPLKKSETFVLQKALELRRNLVLNNNDKVFLYVGGLIPMKHPILLIEAFLKLYENNHNIQLWIIGDGPLRSVVEKRIQVSNNHAIKFFGRIVDEVDPYFAAADWFVLPGCGGLALNQAMFWKTPCITAFADGTEDDLIFEGITGYRFIDRTPENLSEAMLKALNTSKEKYIAMGNFSKYLVEERSNTNTMLNTFRVKLKKYL